jgi:hypothetical protein
MISGFAREKAAEPMTHKPPATSAPRYRLKYEISRL